MAAEFRVFRSLEEASAGFAPSAATIGNFDGVHLGHQRLFRQLAEMGRRLGVTPSVITFDPHPARVVAPERAPRLLSAIAQRLEWMQQQGIQQALVIPFDAEFAHLTPEQFVQRVLVEAAGVRAVLVGPNFRFGNRQAGTTELLRRLGERFGFAVEVTGDVRCRDRMVSSTEIRRLIEGGRVAQASRLLGRPYCLEGCVVTGHGVGARLTVPTLNLETTAEVLPARGVYVSRTADLETGRRWPSVTNVGFRPTFSGDALSIESFLLDGFEEPAPLRIRIEFLHRLRDERKFPDPAALKAQILRDVRRSRAYLRRLGRWVRAGC